MFHCSTSKLLQNIHKRVLDMKHRIFYNFFVSWQILIWNIMKKMIHIFSNIMEQCHFFAIGGVMSKREKFSCESVAEEWRAFRKRTKTKCVPAVVTMMVFLKFQAIHEETTVGSKQTHCNAVLQSSL